MQYQRLTAEQKKIRNWRSRRNHLVCDLLAKNPHMTRQEALTLANKKMRGK
jgi:hypothetical protein